ncbi:uncharacterized protein V1510DRAFT_415315 [Dipodascopsis tothii]|uniref:uncharacterized protein n=1 Tax=Dipodascopsis tothii TaxID=44089 RepID=UPI0034CFD9DD
MGRMAGWACVGVMGGAVGECLIARVCVCTATKQREHSGRNGQPAHDPGQRVSSKSAWRLCAVCGDADGDSRRTSAARAQREGKAQPASSTASEQHRPHHHARPPTDSGDTASCAASAAGSQEQPQAAEARARAGSGQTPRDGRRPAETARQPGAGAGQASWPWPTRTSSSGCLGRARSTRRCSRRTTTGMWSRTSRPTTASPPGTARTAARARPASR